MATCCVRAHYSKGPLFFIVRFASYRLSQYYTDKYRRPNPEDDPIYVGMIVKNLGEPGRKAGKFKLQFTTLLRSILKRHRGSQRDLHFVLMTDERSVPCLRPILVKYIPKDLTNSNQSEFEGALLKAD